MATVNTRSTAAAIIKHHNRLPPVAVEQLRHEVATLSARVARLERRCCRIQGPGILQRDPAADASLLAIIAARTVGHVFSLHELRQHAALHPDLSHALQGRTTRELGTLFRRLCGRDCGGVVVRLIKRAGAGRLWCVVPVDDDRHAGD